MSSDLVNKILVWSLLEEIVETLGDNYAYPAMDKAAQEYSLSPDYYTWASAVWLFSSGEFTIRQFMRVFPYGLAQVNEERFMAAIRQGFLTFDGHSRFHATDSGMNVATCIFLAVNKAIAPIHPMPEQALDRLGDLLARISDATFEAPEPPVHFILSRKRDLYRRMGMIESLEGLCAHCLEMEGHRDDAYITRWQAHQVEGHAWEMLDLLSRGEAQTFDDLHEKLGRRGVTEDVHAEDVRELTGRRWVEIALGKIQITAAGKQMRAEVEAETERLFFASWSCLSEAELDELASLASQLRDGLRTKGESS